MQPNPTLAFVHRFVPASDSPPSSRTLLLLHGTGGNETDLLDLGRSLSPGSALLSPRGRVSEHGAPRFFRRLAEGVFDLPDLHAQTAALATFVTDAAKAYGFDPKGVVAVGFSNGANIAASLLLSHPGILAAAVLLRPMVPFEPTDRPKLDGVPVLIASGSQDPMVSTAQRERLARLLRDGGADVTVSVEPAGHGLTQSDIDTARHWLRQRPL